MKTQTLSNTGACAPGLLFAMVSLVAILPVQAQTLIHYTLDVNQANLVAEGIVPNAGTLGNGTVYNGIFLDTSLPTAGVPPEAGNASIGCDGDAGILAPGTQQLNNTAIANAGGFTYETWFYWTGTGDINAIIDYAGTQKLIRPAAAAGPEMQYYNTNNSPVSVLIGATSSNQWHYVAVVFTSTGLDSHTNVSGTFTFYLDTNAPTGSASGITISPFGDSLDRSIAVGMHPAEFSSDFFNGLIYEPRVTLGALPSYSLLFKPSVVVTTTNDSGTGSLRSAVASAPNGAAITFASALNGETVSLTTGQINIGTNLTIDASALANGISVSGSGNSRIFEVYAGVNTINVMLNSLTLVSGLAPAGTYPADSGGGILNMDGNLTLNNCTLEANDAEFGSAPSGGGIENYFGTLTLNNSTFYANFAVLRGGGIDNGAGKVIATNCTFEGNLSANYGGAIEGDGGTVTLKQCTLAYNSVGASGGGGVDLSGATLNIDSCIVAGNTAANGHGPDISSASGTVSAQYCLIGNGFDSSVNNGSSGNIVGPTNSPINPLLANLGNYGGPTQTMPPLFGSPAIDMGDNTTTNSLATDQRGYPRLSGSQVDMGAVEAQYAPANSPPLLKNAEWSIGGGIGGENAFLFTFTNAANVDFSALGATSLAQPVTWTALGEANQTSSGQYQFTDTPPTNAPARYYRIVSP